MELGSENLILRAFEQSDATTVRELAGEYDVAKTTLHIPHPYGEGVAEAWIERTHEAAEEGRVHTFAIVRVTDQALLGAISLGVSKEHSRAELAYWMGKPYWGHGYTTEAAKAMLKFGFQELGLNRIFAFAFSSNPASARVMQKIGMTLEGTYAQHVCKWGQYHDVVGYGVLKGSYLEQR